MKKMIYKKTILRFSFLALVAILMASCENEENLFEDFKDENGDFIKNVYFPIQYPVRTLSLNEFSRLDNSLDLNQQFSVGVGIGGLYTNDKTRTVTFEVAPELVTDALINGNTMQALPTSYYSLSNESEMVIPSGEFNGTVQVSLTDAFFQDPLAIGANYVLPLRITSVDDPEVGILDGVAADGVTDPDPRAPADWNETPKDYTLFAVKFVNRIDGIYLHKGRDATINGPGGNVLSEDVYDEEFLEQNFTTVLSTVSLTETLMTRVGRDNANSMLLSIDENNDVVVSAPAGSPLNISGTGKLYEPGEAGSEEWGGKSYQTLILDYTYDDQVDYHQVRDVLVYRNDGLLYEEFSLELQ